MRPDELIDLGPRVIPLVNTWFQTERDPAVRTMLVNVAWQTRSITAVPLLAQALDDTEPSVWKEALDGLVTLGGSIALDTARNARDRAGSEKVEWLDEAIQQITEMTRRDVE